MPEPSASDRRKAADLGFQLAATRLVDCLEQGEDIRFKCQYCGTTKTWGRWELTTAHRDRLGMTLAEVQARVHCPRCPGRMPAVALLKGGYQDRPTSTEADRRSRLIELLLDCGIDPGPLGYAWRPPGQ